MHGTHYATCDHGVLVPLYKLLFRGLFGPSWAVLWPMQWQLYKGLDDHKAPSSNIT